MRSSCVGQGYACRRPLRVAWSHHVDGFFEAHRQLDLFIRLYGIDEAITLHSCAIVRHALGRRRRYCYCSVTLTLRPESKHNCSSQGVRATCELSGVSSGCKPCATLGFDLRSGTDILVTIMLRYVCVCIRSADSRAICTIVLVYKLHIPPSDPSDARKVSLRWIHNHNHYVAHMLDCCESVYCGCG